MNAPAQRSAHAPEGPPLTRVDPRLRILAAVGLSIAIAMTSQWPALVTALGAAILAVITAGIPMAAALRRTAALNAVMLMMAILLPLSTPGEPVAHLGSMAVSGEGLRLAATVAIKGNAIVLLLMALIGTLEPVTLGHALDHLYVPSKLSLLLLFTVRYVEVLHGEYLRLRAAMKVRGFRARVNRHTYRSLGHLAGMLLVRSFERSERVMAAMKCRGFHGHFHLLDHFRLSRADPPFVAAAMLLAVALGWFEWGLR